MFWTWLGVMLVVPWLAALRESGAPDSFAETWARVRTAYRRRLDAIGMIGSALMVVRDGVSIAHESYGWADREGRRPVDRNTIFHWASCTKPFTAIALLQLRDAGKLHLDDPLVAFLPELRQVYNPFRPMEAITLRHVLAHTAGFRAASWPWGGNEPWHPHEPASWAQIAAMLPYTRIHEPPGTRYRYSNFGLLLIGQVIERVAGEAYTTYVEKQVLRPLGMRASYFDGTPSHLRPYRAHSYTVRDGTAHDHGPELDTGITVANGGLNAPLTDMARFLGFLTGTGDTDRKRLYDGVLARTSLREMWVSQHPVAKRGRYQESVGLAFHLLQGEDFFVAGHTGHQRSYQACFYADPATRVGIMMAFNATGAPGYPPHTRDEMYALRTQLFDEVMMHFGGPEVVI